MKQRASAWEVLVIFTLIFLSACASRTANLPPASQASTPASAPGAAATGQSAPKDQAIIPVTSTQTAVSAATPAAAGATTPAAAGCTSPASLTPAETEGPFFKAGSPERSALADGLAGTKLTLTGYVLDTACQPVANARLDFWQANAQGQYDNSGYTLRGHLTTDASGRYQVETIVPGLYPGRTEHIHVKVQAPNGPVLTTQLFFPGVAQNNADGIFDPRLLMNVQQASGGWTASFNFVVATK